MNKLFFVTFRLLVSDGVLFSNIRFLPQKLAFLSDGLKNGTLVQTKRFDKPIVGT